MPKAVINSHEERGTWAALGANIIGKSNSMAILASSVLPLGRVQNYISMTLATSLVYGRVRSLDFESIIGIGRYWSWARAS